MFLNLTTNDRRGTANSTLYVSWDLGIGIGILIGGVVAEHLGYNAAFMVMSVVNALGVLFYFVSAKKHFTKWRLR
jgi:predicted MFS family arabinose efflux permease